MSKSQEPKTVVLKLTPREYATVMKAARVWGIMTESLMMQTGHVNAAGEHVPEKDFVDESRGNPVAGALEHYLLLLQGALIQCGRTPSADTLHELSLELFSRKK